MGFNARQAKLLPAGSHIIVDGAPGLRLTASATRKTWIYRYKSPLDGRMRQIAIGQWPEKSYAAALSQWEELRQRRDAGEDPAQAKRHGATVAKTKAAIPDPGVYTVARLIEDYLVGHVERHRKPKGQAETRRLCVNYTATIAHKPAAQLARADAFRLLEDLAARAPVLANTLRTELGAAWDYALDAGRLPEETPNWWRQILRGKLRSRGKIVDGEHQGRALRVLDDQEVGVLLRWLPNFTALEEDLLTLYLWTATRGAEIVAICGREVTQEEDGWWWTIPRSKTKMARHALATDLRVPLVGRALKVVQRRIDLHGDGYLFPARQPAKTEHVSQRVLGVTLWQVRPSTETPNLPKVRARILHMDPFSPHDLRRTVRTKLAALGCPDAVGEALLGHMPTGIVGVYNRHSYDEERRKWLAALSDHWEGLALK